MAAGLLWDVSFPINKNLWTSSYVLFTSGLAAMALALLHRAVDASDRPRTMRHSSFRPRPPTPLGWRRIWRA